MVQRDLCVLCFELPMLLHEGGGNVLDPMTCTTVVLEVGGLHPLGNAKDKLVRQSVEGHVGTLVAPRSEGAD